MSDKQLSEGCFIFQNYLKIKSKPLEKKKKVKITLKHLKYFLNCFAGYKLP